MGKGRAAQASDRTVIDYTAAVLAGAKVPFKQCFDLANGPVSVRLSAPDPSAAAIRARFGRLGTETAIAADSQVHVLTLPAGTACLELENTTAVPTGASPAAVDQATATVAVEVKTVGSASPPSSADEKILLDARHSTTQGSFCIRLPEGVLSAATSLDRILPNTDYDVYSVNTRPASKINVQAAVTGSQQSPATTITTVRQGTYCAEASRSFSDTTGSHTAPLESVDVRLAWQPAGIDLFAAFPPKAPSPYTPDDVPNGLPFATIDEAVAAAPPGGTPLEASPVPVLVLPDTINQRDRPMRHHSFSKQPVAGAASAANGNAASSSLTMPSGRAMRRVTNAFEMHDRISTRLRCRRRRRPSSGGSPRK